MANTGIDIKIHLKRKGITQRKIAEILKISPVSVHDVIAGKRKTTRIREFVALAINMTVNEIWPEQAEDEEKK